MSLNSRLAAYFIERPHQWMIDAREFFRIAGSMGWRTRVSELRRLHKTHCCGKCHRLITGNVLLHIEGNRYRRVR